MKNPMDRLYRIQAKEEMHNELEDRSTETNESNY